MNIIDKIKKFIYGLFKIETPNQIKEVVKKIWKIKPEHIQESKRKQIFDSVFHPAKPAPGVVPKGEGFAFDEAFGEINSWAGGLGIDDLLGRQFFLGYPLLAELAQRPEFRKISEIMANEMTRKWIELQSSGGEDKTDRINAMYAVMKRLDVQGAFKKIALQDGFFGRAHLYLDLGTTDNREELKTPIGDGTEDSQFKIGPGGLKAVRPVEAVWTYPANYNSNDPLRADWYNPNSWFVNGVEIHSSRLLMFVGREVPDLLKPAYSFGGLSLTQMAKPYVENWLRTRQSVSDIIHSFSVFVLKTNLAEKMETATADQFMGRIQIFNNLRDNTGVFLLDKDLEEFENIAAPIAGLSDLQAQSQEHMSSVAGIPLVKLLGIQPKGLNATSNGEFESFYTWVHSCQVSLFDKNITKVLNFIQLSIDGQIDSSITHKWNELDALDEKEAAEVNRLEAETGKILVESNIITKVEERKRLASNSNSGYNSIDPNIIPPLTEIEKATIGAALTTASVGAADVVGNRPVLEELSRQSAITGMWQSITPEDVADAKDADDNPPIPETFDPSNSFGNGPGEPKTGSSEGMEES